MIETVLDFPIPIFDHHDGMTMALVNGAICGFCAVGICHAISLASKYWRSASV